MNNLDLRQLRYFVAVAEELHFGRAALRLHISQPPLSQQIQALEATLGVRLFERTKHKVEITAAGTQLLKDARALLSEAQKTTTRVKAAEQGQIGTLHIGLNYTSPLSPSLSSALYHFSKQYPDVGLEFHENTSAKQLVGLQNRSLDLCFIWPTLDDLIAPIKLHKISNDALQMVLRSDHPLARRKQITATDLHDYPIFLTARQTRTDFFTALETACKKAGFRPDIRTDIIQMPFILNFIVTGFGVTFLPEFLTRIRPRGVLFRPCAFLSQQVCRMPLALAHRAHDTSPLVQNFVHSIGG